MSNLTVLSYNLRSHFRELLYMEAQWRLSPIYRGLAFGNQMQVSCLARITPLTQLLCNQKRFGEKRH